MELYQNLIVKSLGLQGVNIENWISCDEDLTLVIYAKQDRSQTKCCQCKNSLVHVHSWKLRKIKAAPMGCYEKVWIYLKQLKSPCYICSDNIRTAEVKITHPNFSNMTYSLVEKAGRLMEEITCEASARLLNINPKTMWNIDQYRMTKMYPDLDYTELNLDKMSADEVHFRTIFGEKSSDKNTIQFVTNLVCTKARKVLSNAMGRGSASLL